jgi:dienelactone hydrolase
MNAKNQQSGMDRRKFLKRSAAASLGAGFGTKFFGEHLFKEAEARASASESVLPGTALLTVQGDIASQMVDGIHQFLLLKTQTQAVRRAQLWNRDYRSREQYERSVAANREHLRHIIGAVDDRAKPALLELAGTFPGRPAQNGDYRIYAVRWSVLLPVTADSVGLAAEGLLLEPTKPPVARVVALPDADWTPEMLVGLTRGVPPPAQFARRLVENGCQVIVPVLINRDDTFSGIPGVQTTNMPHREWIYRMAFEVGRHIIGYEVQKVLAAVDWFEKANNERAVPIGVVGYGEGGLLALYSAAIDTRIDATLVSGYFQAREVWKEPIYRDVWGVSREFGDAELASVVAPRALIVEACEGPQVDGPPPATEGRKDYACPNGKLVTAPLEAVQGEVDRSRAFFAELHADAKLQLVVSEHGQGPPGSEPALRAFLESLGKSGPLLASGSAPSSGSIEEDPTLRLHRQFNEIVDLTQALIRKSPARRREFWKKADASSLPRWKETTKFYRDYIWDELIGRVSDTHLPSNPRTRLVLDKPKFTGYEVMLDVWPGVFAYGILLLPKDRRPGERRPVVVCQHGLEGRPSDVADPKVETAFYHHFGADLAEEGFVVFAPQNPYIGHDRFRMIQRLGHPLKLALFSFILGQHEQLLDWLAEQPFVDAQRIGFYGLSYGGKTAVRVPPLLDRYALSICSGDFNEWVWKTTTVIAPQSYLLTVEYDMYEFDFANVVNYSDLANLMAPRPFMVERGHDDPVGVDEWVSFEYAAVRRFYDKMGIADKTEIEFFNGPHTIHGVGTFAFLRRHLKWPESNAMQLRGCRNWIALGIKDKLPAIPGA